MLQAYAQFKLAIARAATAVDHSVCPLLAREDEYDDEDRPRTRARRRRVVRTYLHLTVGQHLERAREAIETLTKKAHEVHFGGGDKDHNMDMATVFKWIEQINRTAMKIELAYAKREAHSQLDEPMPEVSKYPHLILLDSGSEDT